jgi:DNA-binding beta-propeller fold protein YncE
LYIADGGNSRVQKVWTNGIITTIAGTRAFSWDVAGDGGPAVNATFWWPAGVVVDPAGNVFVADEAHGDVRKVSPDGLITTVFQGSRSQSLGGYPAGIALALDHDGNLFVSDGNHNLIQKVALSGAVTTIAGTGASGFSGDGGQATEAQIAGPCGLAVDAFGNLYFVDSGNSRVRKVTREFSANVGAAQLVCPVKVIQPPSRRPNREPETGFENQTRGRVPQSCSEVGVGTVPSVAP